jgi:hypothetical protein
MVVYKKLTTDKSKGFLVNKTKTFQWVCPCAIKPGGRCPVNSLNRNWIYRCEKNVLEYEEK